MSVEAENSNFAVQAFGSDFNPHSQEVLLYYPDGTNVSLPLTEFNIAAYGAVKMCVTFGAQIGACGILLVLVPLLTTAARRGTPLFAFNILSLALVVVRSVLQILYYTGPWYDTYNYMAWDWSDVPKKDKIISVSASISAVSLVTCVLASLILQIRVVYQAVPKVQTGMTIFTCLLAASAVAIWFWTAVENAQSIMKVEVYGGNWKYVTAKALFTANICIFSICMVIKLAIAIRQRNKLGMKKFGPLQVIFIMSCQTMVLPAIFAILENVVDFDGLGSLTFTLVAMSLPLTAVWASMGTSTSSSSASPKWSNGSGGSLTRPGNSAAKSSKSYTDSEKSSIRDQSPTDSGFTEKEVV